MDDWVVSSLVFPVPSVLFCSASSPGFSPLSSSEQWQSRDDCSIQPLQSPPVTEDKAETPGHEICLAAPLLSTLTLAHSPEGYCLMIPGCLAFTVHRNSSHLCIFDCVIPLSWNLLSHLLNLMYFFSSFSYTDVLPSRKLPWNPRRTPFLLASAVTVTNLHKHAHYPIEHTLCLHAVMIILGQENPFPPLTPQYVCVYVCVLATQLCPTLCDPMDCCLPGSSVHGILQARILEWVAILSFRGSSWPRDWTSVSVSPSLAGRFLSLNHLGSPWLHSAWHQTTMRQEGQSLNSLNY